MNNVDNSDGINTYLLFCVSPDSSVYQAVSIDKYANMDSYLIERITINVLYTILYYSMLYYHHTILYHNTP